MEEEPHNVEERGFLSWIRGKFSGSERTEEDDRPHYKRRLFDGRIEKYLDNNLDAFISEYGIVTALDLELYEQRYIGLTGRIREMSEYMADADAYVSAMEIDMKAVRKTSRIR